MRRLILPSAALSLCGMALCLIAGCGGSQKTTPTAESSAEQPVLVSIINMGDPRSENQLTKGFFNIEVGSWRWTAPQFDLVLGVPKGASEKGAMLVSKFSLPEVELHQLKSLKLTATVNGLALAPETYSKPGDYTYSREVPASSLTGDKVPVSFQLDKPFRPTNGDPRDLGLVVKEIGFELK